MVANRLRDAAAVLEVDSAYRRDAAIMREAADEVDRLRHDIERHVEIACELATECERLRAELANLKALLRSICEEWNEGCDPACDSFGHTDTCKGTNIAQAKRAMRDEIERLRAELIYVCNLLVYLGRHAEDGKYCMICEVVARARKIAAARKGEGDKC